MARIELAVRFLDNFRSIDRKYTESIIDLNTSFFSGQVGRGVVNGLGQILISVDLEKDEDQMIIEKIKCDDVKTNGKEILTKSIKLI